MADITMCTNQTCIAADYCYRQRATPGIRQSVSEFTPKNNVRGEAFDCEYFYSMQEEWFKRQTTRFAEE